MAVYEVIRQQHVAYAMARLTQHVDRVAWSAERLRMERTRRLRALLRTARERSPWHRSRLAGVDVDGIDEQHLDGLPTMTKSDLMANFDSIVADRRITLDVVEAHLAALTSDGYLFDEFHAFASGGSSGVRGVFVWGGTPGRRAG